MVCKWLKTVFCKTANRKLKLSLHSSSAFCFRQILCRNLPQMQLFNAINLHLSIYVTTNITAKPVTFLQKQIMAAQWSRTCAAVKLLLFQDNDLCYSIQPVITIKITDTTQGEMSDGSRAVNNLLFSRNLENAKNCFIEAKTYQISELVIPHDTLFHHQLDFTTHLT